MVGVGCQMRVLGGGQDGAVAEDFLHFEQVDAGFDQMCCITVTKTVRGNLFLSRTLQPPCAGLPARRHGRVGSWHDELP